MSFSTKKIKTDYCIEEKIKNRESWLKVAVIAITTLVLAYKLISSNISVDLSQISFSDLLSLILAIFAIWLSIAFYFKASDSSNAFYDNTYKFTKDISEILGRIEAGFGEKLNHLDEGYSTLRNSMITNNSSTNKIVKQDEQELNKIKTEREDLLKQLAQREQLDQKEKDKLLKRITEKDETISMLNSNLVELKSRFNNLRRNVFVHSEEEKRILSILIDHIDTFLLKMLPRTQIASAPPGYIIEKFNDISHPHGFLEDMKIFNYVDEELKLTYKGAILVRNIARGIEVTPYITDDIEVAVD